MKVIGAGELRRLVPMPVAIDAVEDAFRRSDSDTPPRQHVPIGEAELLFMPAWNPRAAGVKLVTISPSNRQRGIPLINGLYLFFDRDTLQVSAAIDAAALTELRTGAVSGVATRALAHPEAARLVIFGAGVQARAHLEAMVAVRPISSVAIVTRTRASGDSLADQARSIGLDAEVAEPGAVAEADVVCTCTTSSEPVFSGRVLSGGAHVNAVGSYTRTAKELDEETVLRAAVVTVESREVMAESGDLAEPLESGALDEAAVLTLPEILDRPRPAHPRLTVFKSVGRAFEDLAVAEAAIRALG